MVSIPTHPVEDCVTVHVKRYDPPYTPWKSVTFTLGGIATPETVATAIGVFVQAPSNPLAKAGAAS